MALNIRNPEADMLARELARIDRTSITDAVIIALRKPSATGRTRRSHGRPRKRLLPDTVCLSGQIERPFLQKLITSSITIWQVTNNVCRQGILRHIFAYLNPVC